MTRDVTKQVDLQRKCCTEKWMPVLLGLFHEFSDNITIFQDFHLSDTMHNTINPFHCCGFYWDLTFSVLGKGPLMIIGTETSGTIVGVLGALCFSRDSHSVCPSDLQPTVHDLCGRFPGGNSDGWLSHCSPDKCSYICPNWTAFDPLVLRVAFARDRFCCSMKVPLLVMTWFLSTMCTIEVPASCKFQVAM